MTCSNIQIGAYRNARATTLLFRRCPPSGAAVRLLERSASAAAGQAADRDNREAIAAGGAVHPAVGTDGASGGLTDNLAAGDDDRVAAGARTRDADGAHNPRAIETVAAAATALARCAARFFRLGFAATCGSLGRARRLSRTGKRFLVIADAAAGAAGLRQRNAASGCDRDEKESSAIPVECRTASRISGASNTLNEKF